jgi:hypothetical protein
MFAIYYKAMTMLLKQLCIEKHNWGGKNNMPRIKEEVSKFRGFGFWNKITNIVTETSSELLKHRAIEKQQKIKKANRNKD